jgi:3-methyladenine DNA glycosylase AlkD
MSIDQFLFELKNVGDPDTAISHKDYHKSVREHWGVTVPLCVALVRKFSKDLTKDLNGSEILSFAKALWKTNIYDAMICATKMVSLAKVKPSKELWATIKLFLKDVDGWALEDQLAIAARKCILADGALLDELEEWTKHPNFWMRRAALVYTLPYAKPGRDPERMLRWAAGYVQDPEWFIQKAIGWWLRDLSAHDPKRVLRFVEENQLKGLAKREAIRKL